MYWLRTSTLRYLALRPMGRSSVSLFHPRKQEVDQGNDYITYTKKPKKPKKPPQIPFATPVDKFCGIWRSAIAGTPHRRYAPVAAFLSMLVLQSGATVPHAPQSKPRKAGIDDHEDDSFLW